MQKNNEHILKRIIEKKGGILPLIVDRDTAISCINIFDSREETVDIEDITTGDRENLYIYRKNDEKKYLSIENIRILKEDIKKIPYTGKSIFVILDFDQATEEAMNATLKILEEPPEYAIILLVVSSPESLLDTIRSRCLLFFRGYENPLIREELESLVRDYKNGKKEGLIQYIYKGDIHIQDAFDILSLMLDNEEDLSFLEKIEEAIINLSSVNENPKYILDTIIL